jgi:hypothetical protein
MERKSFELDAIALAAAEKFGGIQVDERHILKIQNQLLPRCLEGKHLLKLLDIRAMRPRPSAFRAPQSSRLASQIALRP